MAPERCASSAIAANISTVMGDFLTTGLAKNLCNPSFVVQTNGEEAGDGRPAVEWTHVKQLHASSTATLDLEAEAKCRRYMYNAKYNSFAGMASMA